jgi:hypothetical protein
MEVFSTTNSLLRHLFSLSVLSLIDLSQRLVSKHFDSEPLAVMRVDFCSSFLFIMTVDSCRSMRVNWIAHKVPNRIAIGDQKKKLLLCSYSRPCSELPYGEIVWCKKYEQKWKEKGIYSGSFLLLPLPHFERIIRTQASDKKRKKCREFVFFFPLALCPP